MQCTTLAEPVQNRRRLMVHPLGQIQTFAFSITEGSENSDGSSTYGKGNVA